MMEKWDLYDRNGQRTENVMNRGDEIPYGFYHLVVHIWVVDGQGKYLIQKRAAGVSWKPGIWAATGGSVTTGETPLNAAIREVSEEVGLRVLPRQMRLLHRMRRTNSFCYVYRVKIQQAAEEFVLQPEEVERVKWASQQEIEAMRKQGTFYDYGDAYFNLLWART